MTPLPIAAIAAAAPRPDAGDAPTGFLDALLVALGAGPVTGADIASDAETADGGDAADSTELPAPVLLSQLLGLAALAEPLAVPPAEQTLLGTGVAPAGEITTAGEAVPGQPIDDVAAPAPASAPVEVDTAVEGPKSAPDAAAFPAPTATTPTAAPAPAPVPAPDAPPPGPEPAEGGVAAVEGAAAAPKTEEVTAATVPGADRARAQRPAVDAAPQPLDQPLDHAAPAVPERDAPRPDSRPERPPTPTATVTSAEELGAGAELRTAPPRGPEAPARVSASSDLAQRIAEVAERMAAAGSPRRMVIEAGALRLAVSLQADGVRVTVLDGADTAGWTREVAHALQQRGLTLSQQGADPSGSGGQRDDRGHAPDQIPSQPIAGAGRRAVRADDLGVRL